MSKTIRVNAVVADDEFVTAVNVEDVLRDLATQNGVYIESMDVEVK